MSRISEAEARSGDSDARAATYCLIPFELAPKLDDLLRRHLAESGIEVIVENRHRERRAEPERRRSEAEVAVERRKIHNAGGRRCGERRATQAELEPDTPIPALPRRARGHADRIASDRTPFIGPPLLRVRG